MIRLKDYRIKMKPDELQMFLYFRRRGGVSSEVPYGKGSYDRKREKKALMEARKKYM